MRGEIQSERRPTNSSPPPAHTNHGVEQASKKNYFDDEMAIFLVHNKLYKVHCHFLKQESDILRLMFSRPSQEEVPEGMDDSGPIILPEVTSREFEQLIDFFYYGMHRQSPLEPEEEEMSRAHFDQAIDLLSISTRYAFDRVRQCAIDMVDSHKPPMDPVEKIILAEKFGIFEWIAPAIESLCQRVNPLELHEGKKIGVDYTILITRAREAVRASVPHTQAGLLYPTPRAASPVEFLPYSPALVTDIVQQVITHHPLGD